MIVAVLAALLAISEVLAFLPEVKSNGVFQLLVNFIKTLKENLKQ